MAPTDRTRQVKDDATEYLSVDGFMGTMLHARALTTAFEIGLVDFLISHKDAPISLLTERLAADSRGMVLLLNILTESGVVENRNGNCSLKKSFSEALRYRELMVLKLAMANIAARDVLDYFNDLVTNPDRFMSRARFHRLFAYDRCHESGEEDRRITKQWMQITTALTRYESASCMQHHDFSPYRRMLDVGGNSGEFVLRLCKNHPDLQATVFDLPLVCEVGMDHVSAEPEADRISFVKGNALVDDLPGGYDLVSFKSMLHDWPDDAAKKLLARASRSLEPGGEMLIFERAPLISGNVSLSYAILPFLIFFHSYRSPEVYAGFMEDLGFTDIQSRIIHLEMPFLLVTGVRGHGD